MQRRIQTLVTIVLLLSSINMGAQIHDDEMKYNKIQVEDCRVFYREAGNPEKPIYIKGLRNFRNLSEYLRGRSR